MIGIVERAAAAARLRARASSSTASRAPSRRPRRSTAMLAERGAPARRASSPSRCRARSSSSRLVGPPHVPRLRRDVPRARSIRRRATGVCDHCGGELYQRDDDREDRIATRLDGLRDARPRRSPTTTGSTGLLREVDGTASQDEVLGAASRRSLAHDRAQVAGRDRAHARGERRSWPRCWRRCASRCSPGVTTAELDALAEELTRKRGAVRRSRATRRRPRVPGRRSASRSTTRSCTASRPSGACSATATSSASTSACAIDGYYGDAARDRAGRHGRRRGAAR